MAEIEFLPESVDTAADEELLASGSDPTPRWLVIGALAAAALLVVALVVSATSRSHPTSPVVAPPTPGDLSTTAVAAPALPRLELGPTTKLPVLGVAVLGSSTWVLQDGGLHVLLPGRDPLQLALPGIAQTARLVPDPSARLVWLVTQKRARAYSPDARLVWDGPVTAFSDVAALRGRLYLAGGTELIEAGPGLPRPRSVFTVPNPLTAVAADPTRDRVVVAYQDGASRVLALRPRHSGRAEVEAGTTIRTVNVTLAVANDAIWLAGFSTGGGALVRLDQTTLRPMLHFAYEGLLGSGAVLVGQGASSVWVRDGVGGPELRCVDARSGAQAQTWQLDGLISSTTGRAVLGTGEGALKMQLGGCRG